MEYPARYGEPDWDRPPRAGEGVGGRFEIAERPLSNKSYEELRLESVQKQWAVKFVDFNKIAVSSGADTSFVNLKNLTDVVEIVVGEKEKTTRWVLHEKLVSADSDFAKIALNGSFKEKDVRQICLPEEDTDIFAEYVRFLYTGCVITFSLERVVQMYTLGDRLQSIKFANACYETIAKSTDYWSASQIKYIFDNTFQEDRLRKLCTKQVGKGVLEGRYSFSLSHEQEMLKEFMPELMQGVTSAVADLRNGGHKWYPSQPSPMHGPFKSSTSAATSRLFAPSFFGNHQTAPTSSGTGLFGASNTSQASTQPSFGFGGQAPHSTASGLFGSSAQTSNGGVFDSQHPPRTGGGLFGTQTQQAPGGGLFGTQSQATGSSLFGTQTMQAPQGSVFGTQPTQATGGLFGTRGHAAGPGLFPAAGTSYHNPSTHNQNPFGQSWQNYTPQPGQQTVSGRSGLFGNASSAGGGPFGSTSATSSAPPATGLFGSAQPSSTAPTFGGFADTPATASWQGFSFSQSQSTSSAPSGPSLFGQVSQPASHANSSTPKFGFGVPSAAQASTAVDGTGQSTVFGSFAPKQSTSSSNSISSSNSTSPVSFLVPSRPPPPPQATSQSSDQAHGNSIPGAQDPTNDAIEDAGGKGKRKATGMTEDNDEVLGKQLFNMAFPRPVNTTDPTTGKDMAVANGITAVPQTKASFSQGEWDAASFKTADGKSAADKTEPTDGDAQKEAHDEALDDFGNRRAPEENSIRNTVMRDMKERLVETDADAEKPPAEAAGAERGDALEGAKETLRGFGARII